MEQHPHEDADSFIMLKPDGIERDIQAELAFELSNKHISIIGETTVKPTPWLPLELWPSIHTHDGWLYSRQYLEGHTLPVLWLQGQGSDVPEQVLDVKQLIRGRICPGERHQTLMHCPDNAEDFRRETDLIQGYEVNQLGQPTLRTRQHQTLVNWLGTSYAEGLPAGNLSTALIGSATEPWARHARDWDYMVFTENDDQESTLVTQESENDVPGFDVRVISLRQWIGRYGLQDSVSSEHLRWILQATMLRDDNERFTSVQQEFATAFETSRESWIRDAYSQARSVRHTWVFESQKEQSLSSQLLGNDFAIRVQQLAYLALGEPFPTLKHFYRAAEHLSSHEDERVRELGTITPDKLSKLDAEAVKSYSKYIFKQLVDPLLHDTSTIRPNNFEWWNIMPTHHGTMPLSEETRRRLALMG